MSIRRSIWRRIRMGIVGLGGVELDRDGGFFLYG
jgi:hypothetical protein